MSEYSTMIIWKNGSPQQAKEFRFTGYFRIDVAAQMLGCDVWEVNVCRPGEAAYYGVTISN